MNNELLNGVTALSSLTVLVVVSRVALSLGEWKGAINEWRANVNRRLENIERKLGITDGEPTH